MQRVNVGIVGLGNVGMGTIAVLTENAKQILDVYNTVGNTGTVTTCLPQWGANGYDFRNYSGTTLSEPVMGNYFQGYLEDFRLLILNVVTNP